MIMLLFVHKGLGAFYIHFICKLISNKMYIKLLANFKFMCYFFLIFHKK